MEPQSTNQPISEADEASKEVLTSEETNQDTNPEQQEPGKPKSPKKLLIVLGLLLIITGAFLAYMLVFRDTTTPNNESDNTNMVATTPIPGSVFCTKLGLDSLHCENLDSKELRKYTLPKSLGDINNMTPSPDGKKYFISTWTEDGDNGGESLGVYDEKLNQISALPVKKDKDNVSDISASNVKWLDDKTLVYVKTDSYTDSKTLLYAYDVNTKQERTLAELEIDLERYMPVFNETYMYGLQPYEVKEENATFRKLVIIDLDTKAIKDIDSSGVNVDDLSYNNASSLFYNNEIDTEKQKFDVKSYKVTDITNTPKLIETQTIKDRYAGGSVAYETIVTNKGLYTTSDLLIKRAPLKFYDNIGNVTESGVGVGNIYGDILLSLPNFPDFPQAEKNEPVVSDFFRSDEGTPEKIVSFLEDKVMNNPECGKGEYTTFELRSYDTDQQFSVSEASCATGGLVFYVADGDSYKVVATTTEGMSCEERDKLGITEKTLPECRLPGEGL